MVGNLAVANDEIVQPMNNDEIIQAPKTKKSLVLRKRRLVSASEDELGEFMFSPIVVSISSIVIFTSLFCIVLTFPHPIIVLEESCLFVLD